MVQGNIQLARALLKLHSAADTVPFDIADQILEMMPIYNAYGGLSIQKFKAQWQHWVRDSESKVQQGYLSLEPELERNIKV